MKRTAKQIEELCKSLVIIIDTREKNADNVRAWCDYKGRLAYMSKKIDSGDYSFMIPKNEELGIMEDNYFDKRFVIEKKGCLDELAQNFTKNRKRFTREFERFKGEHMIVVVNSNWDDLFLGNYQADFNRRSFIGSVMSFENKYNISFRFVSPQAFPVFIYTQFYYYIRHLANNELI